MSLTPPTVVMLCVLVAVAGCARFAQSSNSTETDPSSAPTATATAIQSPLLAIVAHGVDQIADPEATAMAYIVSQTHTKASDWKLLNKAVTDIGPYPDAAWSGKFYNGATKEDACVIVLADDRVLDCSATNELRDQAEAQLTEWRSGSSTTR